MSFTSKIILESISGVKSVFTGGGTGLADPTTAGPIISAHHTEMAKCMAEIAVAGPRMSVHYNILN